VVGLVRGICNRREDILTLEARMVRNDLFDRGFVRQQLKDISDSDAFAADARSSPALARFHRDAIQKSIGHEWTVALRLWQ
jgi:hypothetical protein